MTMFHVCNDFAGRENFVSIATNVDNAEQSHAAIIIRYQSVNYLYHYPGVVWPTIQRDAPPDQWGVFSIIKSIKTEDEVGAVLAFCNEVCKHARPQYEFLGPQGQFNPKGRFVSYHNLPEAYTCVGFCICTLNRILPEAGGQYLDLDDWPVYVDHSSLSRRGLANLQGSYPNVDWDSLEQHRKRVRPDEYFCTSFITDYPIRKARIDSLMPSVKVSICQKFGS